MNHTNTDAIESPDEQVSTFAAKFSHDTMTPSATATLPTRFGDFRVLGFEHDNTEYAVLVRGDVAHQDNIPVRLHSECFTGDVMGSLRCDCRDQLELALETIGTNERGVVVYLPQEGRGIGLINKIKAYALQDQGMDTVEANHALGFPDDLRTYGCAAEILKALDVQSVELLSNNPSKRRGLEMHGMTVNRMRPIRTPTNPHNSDYISTKREKCGHLI